MMKDRSGALRLGIAGLAASLALSACDDDKSKQAGGGGAGGRPKPAVEVVTLHAQPVPLVTELPARTSAFRTADVRPQVSGVILKRLFVEGDDVTAGQQLYQIDPAPYEAALASAQASLAHAKAEVQTAQATVDRYKPLVEANAVSHQDLDNAVGTLLQGQADVASAEASVKTAAINLAYTKVFSPIAGRTGRSSVTEGALVTSQQTTALVTVTQLDPIYVDANQPSATLIRLKRELASGQIKAAKGGKVPVKLALEDGSAYDQPGALQFSEVTVDTGTGAVTLRALFPNKGGLLLPGMFVREEVEEGVRQGAILAPQIGVTHNAQGLPTALVVGADGKVEARTLTTDRAVGDQWLVTSGLNDGDKLIVKGVMKVQPGAEVTATEAGTAPAAPPAQPAKP